MAGSISCCTGSNRFRLIAERDLGTAYRQADVDLAAFDDSEPRAAGD